MDPLNRFVALGFVASMLAACFQDSPAPAPVTTSSGAGAGDTGGSGSGGNYVPPATVGEPCSPEGSLECGAVEPCPGSDADSCPKLNWINLCEDGTWTNVFQCPGNQDCGNIQGHDSVSCGTEPFTIYYAIEGTPCSAEGAAACTFDQSKLLSCQVGEWVELETCSDGVQRCEYVADGDRGIECFNNADYCLACVDY